MRLFGKKAIPIVFSLALITFSLMPMSGYSLKPEELTPPRITSPLYEGAEVVEVWGVTPKAEVTIYATGADYGRGSCYFDRCTINVKKISAGQKITATQTVDGITSDPTRDEHAVTVQKIPDQSRDPKYNKERLLAPLVDSPLVECQRIVPVKNLVEGALVQVFSPPNITDSIGETKTPWNYARPGTTELKKDQKIVANQKLFFPNPSDLSSPEEIVKDTPTKLEDPVIDETNIVVGSDAVGVRNLWIGAKVDIYYEEPGKLRESIGGGFAPWSGTVFPVKPIKAAWADCAKCIKADQSLCKIKAASAGTTVKNSLDPLAWIPMLVF